MVSDVFDAATGKALSAQDLFEGGWEVSNCVQTTHNTDSPGKPSLSAAMSSQCICT